MDKKAQRPFPLVVLLFSIGYASHFLTGLGFSVVVIPIFLLLSPFPRVKHRLIRSLLHGYLAFMTRTYLPWLSIYRVSEISGLSEAREGGPAIFVANHRSRLDAAMLLGLLKGTAPVIKSKYTRVPAYAFLVKHFDFVAVNQSDLGSLSEAIKRCRSLLESGRHVLIFPEGGRTSTGRLQPFKDLAFRIAKETRARLVPVIVHSSCPFMCKCRGSLYPRTQMTFTIRFLQAVQPDEADTAAGLSDGIHRRMAAELKALDQGTVWEV